MMAVGFVLGLVPTVYCLWVWLSKTHDPNDTDYEGD
jgi:hypothetical protein